MISNKNSGMMNVEVKMRTNRVLVIFLILIMSLALYSCSGNSSNPDINNEETEQENDAGDYMGLSDINFDTVALFYPDEKEQTLWFFTDVSSFVSEYDENNNSVREYTVAYDANITSIFIPYNNDGAPCYKVVYSGDYYLGTLVDYNDCETKEEIIERALSYEGAKEYDVKGKHTITPHLDPIQNRYLERFDIAFPKDADNYLVNCSCKMTINPIQLEKYYYGGFCDYNKAIVTRCSPDCLVELEVDKNDLKALENYDG